MYWEGQQYRYTCMSRQQAASLAEACRTTSSPKQVGLGKNGAISAAVFLLVQSSIGELAHTLCSHVTGKCSKCNKVAYRTLSLTYLLPNNASFILSSAGHVCCPRSGPNSCKPARSLCQCRAEVTWIQACQLILLIITASSG